MEIKTNILKYRNPATGKFVSIPVIVSQQGTQTQQVLPKISEVELLSTNWRGSGNLYHQVVEIAGVTPNSQVDLTPSVQQLAVFYEKDLAFVTENNNGTVTVYVIGQKPQNDYTIQVTITEVEYYG